MKKEKQRSTKHTHKTKDLVTRTPLKTGGELKSYNYYLTRDIFWNGFCCLTPLFTIMTIAKLWRVRSLVSLHNTWRVCVEKCWPKLFCLLSIARQYDLVLFNKWAFDWVSSMVEDLRKVWRYQRGNCYVITVIRVLCFVSPYNRSTVSYGETHNILDVNNYFHHYHENDKYSA
jgi:hypothetical protein